MFACALALGFPFKNQTLSFIGFGLGCQVIKSCLKTLHQIRCRNIIHEITFLGGAIDCLDKSKHTQLWQKILSDQIPGTIKNVYTKKDFMLLLYTITGLDWAIGRNAIFIQKTAVRNFALDNGTELVVSQSASFKLKNYDLKSLASESCSVVGHTNYKANLKNILEFIS